MTLLTVSNQGFTVHNHMCGINFLSHLRGAPQSLRRSGMTWNAVGYLGRGGCGNRRDRRDRTTSPRSGNQKRTAEALRRGEQQKSDTGQSRSAQPWNREGRTTSRVIGKANLPLRHGDTEKSKIGRRQRCLRQEIRHRPRSANLPLRHGTRRAAPRSGKAALTVLAIQQFAHRLAAGFVRLFRILVLRAASAATGRRIGGVSFAASGTAVGKAGLVRLQLKLFCANHADFNGEGHDIFRIQGAGKVLFKKSRSGQAFGLAFSLAWPFCSSTVYSTALQPYSFCSCVVFCFTNFLNESKLAAAALFSPVFLRASVSA
jgi:hypothetical protein